MRTPEWKSDRVAARPRRARSPLVAALLSLAVPGVGHLYVGRPMRGLATFLAVLGVLGLTMVWFSGILPRFWGVAATLAVLGAAVLFAWIDPAVLARRIERFERRGYNRAPVYLAALVAGASLLALPIHAAGMAKGTGFSGLHRAASGSMEPTLVANEVFLTDMTYYTRHRPRRGDVVVFLLPGQTTFSVKRIAALEGDRIAIVDGRAVVNGDAADEPYANAGNPRAFFNTMTEMVVPPGTVFVLGDNRPASIDSRSENRHGPVAVGDLKGRVTEILYSRDLSRIGRWVGDP